MAIQQLGKKPVGLGTSGEAPTPKTEPKAPATTETVEANQDLDLERFKTLLSPDARPARFAQNKEANVFGEAMDPEVRSGADWEKRGDLVARLKTDGEGLAEGRLGGLWAARFINRFDRHEGDFRYRYGENAFRAWMRTNHLLDSIPKGELADRLDLDLLCKVSETSFVHGDEPLGERLYHVLQSLQSRGEFRAGMLRPYDTNARPGGPYSEQEYQAFLKNGITLRELPGSKPGARTGIIIYAPAAEVRPRLEKLLEQTRAALKDPRSDIIQVAANFAQQFSAIHPFQDGNGRIARLMLDRILAERGVLPPILRSMGEDVSLMPEQYAAEVAKGVARMAQALERPAALGPLSYARELFAARGVALDVPVEHKAPVWVDGMPYALGPDGFVHDMMGRPFEVSEGELVPLGHLTYFLLMRRLSQQPDPARALEAYTASSRAGFGRIAEDPRVRETTPVVSDAPLLKADNEYRLLVDSEGNEALVALFNPAPVGADTLFSDPKAEPGTSVLAEAMSRYQQLDLELWHVLKALVRAGDSAGATKVSEYRESLFTMGRAFLLAHADPERRRPGNELGFRTQYEQLMYQSSSLSRPTLRQAQLELGDDHLTAWCTQLGVAQWTGVHPEGDSQRPDSRDLARLRDRNLGAVNVLQDLQALEGPTDLGYLVYTTQPGTLTSREQLGQASSGTVSLSAIPEPTRSVLRAKLGSGETISVDGLRELLLLPVRPAVPAGQVDLSGIDPDVAAQVIERFLRFSEAPQDKKAELRARVAASRRERSQAGWAERVLAQLSDRPQLVRVDDLLPDWRTLADQLAAERDFLTLRLTGTGNGGLVNSTPSLLVTAQRRVFEVRMSKADVLPGTWSVGGPDAADQNLIGVESVRTNQLRGAFTHGELCKAL